MQFIGIFWVICIFFAYHYQLKAVTCLTQAGHDNYKRVKWGLFPKDEYFTEEGLRYRKRAIWILIGGFIITIVGSFLVHLFNSQ